MLEDRWRAFECDLDVGLACAAEADATGEWPEEADIEQAAEAFRQDRDLLAASDLTAWLAREGLTAEAWMEGLTRRLLRHQWHARAVTLLDRHASGLARTEEAVVAEGVCNDQFRRMAVRLAEHVAVATTSTGHPHDSTSADRVLASYSDWLAALDLTRVRRHLLPLTMLTPAFHSMTTRCVTDESMAMLVSRNRLDWMRVDLERVVFAREDAAREAALCARHDGLSLTDIAQDAHRGVQDTSSVLDQLDPSLQQAVLAAATEEIIGPIPVGDAFEVALVVAKTPPRLSDPLVRARARDAIVRQEIDAAVMAHVRWRHHASFQR